MKNYYNGISILETTNKIEKKIIDAFIEIYENKPIEKISIKMITDLAGLNRGTFYLHYLDIYDLLEKIESKFHNISKSIAFYTVNALFNNEIIENALPNIEFYKSNMKYFKVLLCMKGKSNLEEIMKKELKKSLIEKYENTTLRNSHLNEYALEYISSAQVATIIFWIKNDMNIPLRDISKLMQNLATNGALNFFKN